MGVSVAEYLGQRTDVDDVQIKPVVNMVQCPFMNSHCEKVKNNKPPVCSVRKTDGTVWITCRHRLCATLKKVPLNDYQKDILYKIGQTVFDESIKKEDVLVKREVRLNVNERTKYNADYVMTMGEGSSPYSGPDRLVLEMQGGGETSNTGKVTMHVLRWETNPDRTNQELREYISKPGTIETNAWRRQQEQFIVKGNVAMKTWKGYGIAFCVGAPLFDYLMQKLKGSNLPNLGDYNWTLALIGISEDTERKPEHGPIPLKIDRERLLFTNYQTFVQALINQGEPSPEAFAGLYDNLVDALVDVPHPGY